MHRTAIAVFLAAAAPAWAQGGLGSNPFGDAPAGFNLGLLGAQAEVRTGDPVGLRVTEVERGELGEQAGLLEGDVIVAAQGRGFTSTGDPVYQLADAMEQVMGGRRAGRLVLTVQRGTQQANLEVTLPGLGAHARTCPDRCQRCGTLMEQSFQFLLEQQRDDGSFPATTGGNNGAVSVTALCGLALMAAGGEPGQGPLGQAVARAKDFLVQTTGEEENFGGMGGFGGGGNWSQVNWSLGYGALFLAEFLRHAEDAAVMRKLEEVCRAIEANQEGNGGWAHGPGGANALGYTDFAAVTNVVLSGYGAAGQVGVELRQDVVDRTVNYLVGTSNGDGGIGYSQRSGQQGVGDAGRTGASVFAFAMAGQSRHRFFRTMANFFTQGMAEVPEGHASPVYHFGLSAMACWEIDGAWNRFLEQFRLELISARKPDGSYLPRPSSESASMGMNTDRGMGPCWATGTYLLVWNLPRGNLFLYGNKRRS